MHSVGSVATVIGACVLAILAPPTQALARPRPGDPGSHEKFLAELGNAAKEVNARVVATYDAHLRAHPNDTVAAMERCKFVGGSLGEYDDATPHTKCLVQLAERFPNDPATILYRLENLWGEEGIALAKAKIEDDQVEWSTVDEAKALAKLAWFQHWTKAADDAADSAARAIELDPTTDVAIILAAHYRATGKRDEAISVLTAHVDGAEKPVPLMQKARELADLQAWPEALRAIEVAASLDDFQADSMLHARVLENLGRTAEARAKYVEQATNDWNRELIMRRLFYIDRVGSDEATAVESYDALRDIGWDADPVARHRLALAVAFPFASWRARDLLGLLCLGGVLLGLLLLPAVWIVPVHYIGLVRRSCGAVVEVPADRWGLLHVWLATYVLLVVELAGLYTFMYAELEYWFSEMLVAAPTFATSDLANFGLFSFLTTAAAVALLLKRNELAAILRSDWDARQTFASAAKWVIVLWLAARVNVKLASALGLLTPPAPTGHAPMLDITTEMVLGAVGQEYGVLLLLLLAAGVVPVVEEVLFRWIMLDGYSRHITFRWANCTQAFCFAVLHDSVAMLPFFLLFGYGLGSLRRKSGGILAGIIVHAAHNALVCWGMVLRGFG